jgi:hypothetical protein
LEQPLARLGLRIGCDAGPVDGQQTAKNLPFGVRV